MIKNFVCSIKNVQSNVFVGGKESGCRKTLPFDRQSNCSSKLIV